MKISGDFRARVLAREWLGGTFLNLGSALTAEMAGCAGFDWLLLDHEHGPGGDETLLQQLQAVAATPATAIVRIAENAPVRFKRALDLGAAGVMVPWVSTADQARAAVSSLRYPPRGIRGVSVAQRANRFGRVPGYLQNAERDICVVVQLETRAAMGEIEAIAAVDGIDGLFIGPGDLSADLGHLGNPAHPEVQAAIADGCRRIRAAGKPAGILAPVEADARRYFEMGFSYVAIGSDVGLLAASSAAVLSRMREATGQS